MLALLFEFQPLQGCLPRYLEIASKLRPSLLQTDGFIYIDRFQSLTRPEVYLSHSLWRDEASIARWRRFEPHFVAQVEAREHILAGYRLRISTVLEKQASVNAVYDQKPGKPVVVLQIQYRELSGSGSHLAGQNEGVPQVPKETFQSLNHPSWFLAVSNTGLQSLAPQGISLGQSQILTTPANYPGIVTARVDRDYSMHERSEAPQFHRSCPLHPSSL